MTSFFHAENHTFVSLGSNKKLILWDTRKPKPGMTIITPWSIRRRREVKQHEVEVEVSQGGMTASGQSLVYGVGHP